MSQAVTNPVLAASPLPYGLPDFDAIADDDFEPALTEAMAGQRAEVAQQRAAQALAAALRLHVQVFQVQPGLGQEGGEVGVVQREGDDLAMHLAHHALGHRLVAEEVGVELVGRDFEQMGQVLELGEFADELDDGGQVARLGGADQESGGPDRPLCPVAEGCHESVSAIAVGRGRR